MANKLTNEEFLKILKERRGDEYTPLDEYKTTHDKIKVRHSCGYEYYVTPNHLLNGRCCPKCSTTRRNIGMDTEWFKDQVAGLTNEYKVLGEYRSGKTKIKMKHLVCGTEFEMRPEDFRDGQRCPACARKRAADTRIGKSDIKFKEKFKELSAGEYELIGEFTGFKNKVKIKHLKCGHEFEMLPRNFLKGNRCPKCFGIPLKTQKEFEDEVYSLAGDEYTVVGEYKGCHRKIQIKHNTCGYIYEVEPNKFLSDNNRCPHCCFKSSSKSEKEVVDYIKTIYTGQVIENYRAYEANDKLHFKEIDIYLPELKTGIEYCGLYWHSEERGKDKDYHKNKMLFFNKKGIHLIQIFEDEWLYKQSIVKSKIVHILKVNTDPKSYARECKIREVESYERNNFLNQYHIQGADAANISIGLYSGAELVAVMSFSKPRLALGQKKSVDGEYELSRYAGKNVIGGFSKLFKYAVMKYNIKHIITYADLRWSSLDNNLYDKNGFTLIGETEPNYWYIPNGKPEREYRFKYRKSELKKLFPAVYDDKKSERDIMREMKYKVIWDCGNMKYEWKK